MAEGNRPEGPHLTVIDGGKTLPRDPAGLEPRFQEAIEEASDDILPYSTARRHFLRLHRVGDARHRLLAGTVLNFLDRFGLSASSLGWTELELFGASSPLRIEDDGRASCATGDCGIAFMVVKSSDCEFFLDKVVIRTNGTSFSVSRSDLNSYGYWSYCWESFLHGT